MSKYKIGITEAGDAGLDLSWVDKLGGVDGAIAITKNPTPQFVEAVISNMDKLIVHATITGYGSSVVEPNVPSPHNVAKSIMNLVDAGFPKEKLVIRVDPIIPTNKGTNLAYSVIERFMALGFARYRISVIDMFPHCRKRFEDANLPLPYGTNFSPSADQLHRVNMAISNLKNIWEHEQPELRIECCAEPGLSEAIQCGCISAYDLNLLRLDGADTDDMGFQRKHCLCYSGKTELLEHKARCPHGCLYCYWR